MQDTIITATPAQLPPEEVHVTEVRSTSVPAANYIIPPPYARYTGINSVVSKEISKMDSIAKAREDSVVRAKNDSIARIQSGYGIVLEDPYYMAVQQETSNGVLEKVGGYGVSWVYALLAVIFCVICFKSKGNRGYIRQLFTNLNTVKLRHNMFDTTVKESSFTFILNVTWIICAGILLWSGLNYYLPMQKMGSGVSLLTGIGLCAGIMMVYKIVMELGYLVAGNVFSDYRTAKEWLAGANSETALESLPLFPLALLSLCYPAWTEYVVWVSVGVIGLGKIMFIFKGFRIFVNQISSFLLFLYYLCTMEVIPIILVLVGARALFENW